MQRLEWGYKRCCEKSKILGTENYMQGDGGRSEAERHGLRFNRTMTSKVIHISSICFAELHGHYGRPSSSKSSSIRQSVIASI